MHTIFTSGFQYRRRTVWVAFILTALTFIISRCINSSTEKETGSANSSFTDYAGDEKCAGCHKEIYESHLQTAHHLTAQPAEEKYIKGSFEKTKNSFRYSPFILLSMEKRDSGFYQVAYYKEEEKKAMRFDMVIGSGVMGQSYLTWRKNRLYQLPITYFTEADQWSNSPGFPSNKVMIDRPVTSRCLECHATYAEGMSGTALEPEAFNKNAIIYGVGCEKCHGPAARHVEYQTQYPGEKKGKYIVNPKALPRQLQLDICALCHGGNIQKTKPSFEFTAGKNLSDYFNIDSLDGAVAAKGNVDVHGNQYGLLKASKCFKMSSGMTCNTCHDTHKNQRGNRELFSAKCINCHNTRDDKFNTATHQQIKDIEKNCIDCHMPAQLSKSIAVFLQGQETPRASLVRTHFISIYPEEIKKFITNLKK